MIKSGYWLILVVMVLFLIGSLMVYNTSSAEILDKSLTGELYTAFFKQLVYATIGILFALFFYRLNVTLLLERSPLIILILSFLLILVLIPGVGIQLNGAKRWIKLLGLSIQPSEFLKVFLPVFLIHEVRRIGVQSLNQFLKILVRVILPCFLVLIEPDNGTFAILMLSLLVLFYLLEINKKYWMVPFLVMVGAAFVLAIQMPHVHQRIEIYRHPEKDILGKGHQPYQAKIAVGSGRLLGRGLGQSLQKLTYLPEARSDYIAAIFAEEFGFIGILILICLYLVLTWTGFVIGWQAKTIENFHLCMILSFIIGLQAFLNLGIISGLLPSKGTNLPFFSQGGSSLVANFMGIGIILSIAKNQAEEKHGVLSDR